jgi:phospholipid/cholesterol/gamma-HCH transport system substrate-binding protein
MSVEETSRSTEVKVGLFVLVGLLMTVMVVLLLGQKRHVFEERAKIYGVFAGVGGLVAGAPVQIAGVNVGTVARITFERSQAQPRIRVDMEITRDALDLVRGDSVARISSQGLLGDKLIDISPGSQTADAVPPGGMVAAATPADLDHLVADASRVMQKLQKVADGAAALADDLSAADARADIKGSLAALHKLLDATAHGQGLAHALFYDRKTARAIGGIASGIDRMVARVNTAVAALQPILDSTDADGRQLVNNLSRAARGLGAVATQVEQSKVVPNMERASADLAHLTGRVRRGEGTLGALVQDPTVYEQLVTILGGVERSRVLRMLVRYAISKDDVKEGQQRVVDTKKR